MKISMKKRKIGYTYGTISGLHSFRKEKSIAFESSLERDLLTVLEFNESVSDVIEQPLTIEYVNKNGKKVNYTPDFLVHFRQPKSSLMNTVYKPLLIEVKPRDKIRKYFKDFRERFKVAIKYAYQNDMLFRIYDEGKIRGQYFENISFLKRYKNLKYSPDEEERILQYLSMVGHTKVNHLLEYLYVTDSQKGIALGQIWNLLANKKIVCFFEEPLTQSSIIWLNSSYKDEMEF